MKQQREQGCSSSSWSAERSGLARRTGCASLVTGCTPRDGKHCHSYNIASCPEMQWQSPSPCQCFRCLHSTFLSRFLRTENSKTVFATVFPRKYFCSALSQQKAAKSSFPEYRQREQSPSDKETGLVYAGIEAMRRERFVVIFGGLQRKCCSPVNRTTGDCSQRLSCEQSVL